MFMTKRTMALVGMTASLVGTGVSIALAIKNEVDKEKNMRKQMEILAESQAKLFQEKGIMVVYQPVVQTEQKKTE